MHPMGAISSILQLDEIKISGEITKQSHSLCHLIIYALSDVRYHETEIIIAAKRRNSQIPQDFIRVTI